MTKAGRSLAPLLGLFLGAACSSKSNPIEDVPVTDTVHNASVSAPVEVVRDEWGVPHIYGRSPDDVAWAEGYVMAADRLFVMDLARRKADGTLSELLGELDASVVDIDIQARVHHMRATVEAGWEMLQASADPADQVAARMLTKFAAGVNAYVAALQRHDQSLPSAIAFLYDPQTFRPWTEVDSLLLGQLQAFLLGFDSDSDIYRTQLEAAARTQFDQGSELGRLARAGIGADLANPTPVDRTYTLPDGWAFASDGRRAARQEEPVDAALLPAARQTVRGMGHDAQTFPTVGSNNWVVGPGLSASGNVLVANDTHLDLANPPTFYMVHLKSTGSEKLDVMGVQFAGIPGVILGMNEHVCWGATVNYIDVTDVYREKVVACDGSTAPCVEWKGGKVPLVARTEEIKVGHFGTLDASLTRTVQLWDVPHHGPIIPRITADHAVEALGSDELSIKYTGYQPAPRLATVIYGLDRARSVEESIAAVDNGFIYGNQNWVSGDDQGHIGWTEYTRTPRRSPSAAPWKVLPGDGSAEWGGDLDPRYIPHAYDPAQGFIATANNDPIGVTDDGDPFFNEPVVDGAPLYLGTDYDPGLRIGRITKRIRAATEGGGKLTLDDMQSIQGDAVTEWGQLLGPTALDGAGALVDALAHPGTHAELTTLAAGADATQRRLAATALALLVAWKSYDTPSGVDEDAPTAAQLADTKAATVFNIWLRHFAARALDDEVAVLGVPLGSFAKLRTVAAMTLRPETLHSGRQANGDALLFADVGSAAPRSKQWVAAAAFLDTLTEVARALGEDPAAWRWGKLHTLTLQFWVPLPALQIPPTEDAAHPNGYPRHGDIDSVDAAGDSATPGQYTYAHGPAIRFACELDRKQGPRARNVLPGGEVLDPASPHYADMMERWRRNQTFDLAFTDADVAATARAEQAAHGNGRLQILPP
jgi:penicillin amidase